MFQPNYEMNPIDEMHAAEAAGKFHYIPPGVGVDDEVGATTPAKDFVQPLSGIEMSIMIYSNCSLSLLMHKSMCLESCSLCECINPVILCKQKAPFSCIQVRRLKKPHVF
jgi:hypothetical protein